MAAIHDIVFADGAQQQQRQNRIIAIIVFLERFTEITGRAR